MPEMMRGLFGEDVPAQPPEERTDRARPADKGTGPAGETCGTCLHRGGHNYGGRMFHKCDLVRAAWTHGPGTDIRLKDAACRHWAVRT